MEFAMKAIVSIMIVILMFGNCSDRPQDTSQETEIQIGWASAFVESNGIRIHYWRTRGSGKPILIMAHGITDYGLNWTSLARKFENDYDIIMYDARGHGLSAKPEGPYDLKSHVEDLAGLIQALGIEKPILMGHSMGGGTVALLSANYPGIPRAVILEDPADMIVHEQPMTEDVIPGWKKMIEEDKARGKQGLIELARRERHKGWTDLDYELWAESKLLVNPSVVTILEGDGFGNAIETYSKITAPTLILKADAKEESRDQHREIARHLKNGKIVHIDGAGHVIRNDRPAETEKVIREFLASLAPAS
jgi:pimeloyl-ACP methyl ester carboxylesterase